MMNSVCIFIFYVTHRNIRGLSHMNKSVLWAVQSVCVCVCVFVDEDYEQDEELWGTKIPFHIGIKNPMRGTKGTFITMGALVMLLQTLFSLFQNQAQRQYFSSFGGLKKKKTRMAAKWDSHERICIFIIKLRDFISSDPWMLEQNLTLQVELFTSQTNAAQC